MSFQNRRYLKLLMVSCLMMAVTFALSSCGGGKGGGGGSYTGPKTSGSLVINSVNQNKEGSLIATSFNNSFVSMDVSTEPGSGHICSGPPESFTVILKEISLRTGQGDAVVWSGSKTLTLNGSGPVPLNDIDLTDKIPTVPITDVILTFDTNARIIGQFGATLFADGLNMTGIYTKSGSSYNAVSHSGGADSYTTFQVEPAESTDVSLDGYGSETVVSTPCSYTYDGVTEPTITILFDLSRMLRFYNGMSSGESGVNPLDPHNKAYFFCHSVFRYSVAGFIGDIGKIHGYETSFQSGGETVKGWMTLILDGEGKFLAGNLLGDDDNDLTIAKGWISSFTGVGPYTVTYQIGADGGGTSTFTIDTFQIIENEGDDSNSTWSGGPGYSGSATFTLKLLVQ